jgi:hypothetical protein
VQDANFGSGTVEIPVVLGAAKIWDRSTDGAAAPAAPEVVAAGRTTAGAATVTG